MSVISSNITLDGYSTYRPEVLLSELNRLEREGELVTGIERSRFVGRCNSFSNPVGFKPGRGYLLMLGKDANALALNTATHTLRFKFNNQTITYEKLIVVTCEAITGGKGNTDNALYLVELADLRILGPLTSINKAYNVYTPTDVPWVYSTNSGSAWLYSEMVENIWTKMPGSFGSLGLSEANFSGTPANYVFHGISAWDALQKVLDDTNHLLTLSRSGSFGVIPAFTASTDLRDDQAAAIDFLQKDSHDRNSYAHKIPANVEVFFPKKNRAWQGSSDTLVQHANDFFHEDPLYSVVVPTGITGAISGTTLAVHDPMPAFYNELGALANTAALDAQAATVAANFAQSFKYADNTFFHRYTGAQSFSPGVEVNTVVHFDFGKGLQTDVIGSYRSRISTPLLDNHNESLTAPANDSAQEHLTLSSKEVNSTPALEKLGEISDRFAVVELTSSVAAFGSGTAKIKFGTNTSALVITWNDPAVVRTISVYDVTGSVYSSGSKLIAWLNPQTGRWLLVSSLGSSAGFPIQNISGETIPIGGIVAYQDLVVISGTPTVRVVKISADYFNETVIVNVSGSTIANNASSTGAFSIDNLQYVRINGGIGGAHTVYGHKPGSFELHLGYEGFELYGDPIATDDGGYQVKARQRVITEVFGKFRSDLNQGQIASFDIYYLNSAEQLTFSGWSLTDVRDIWLNKNEVIESGTKAVVKYYCTAWVLWQAYCKKDNTGTPSSGNAALLMDMSPGMAATTAAMTAAVASTTSASTGAMGASGVP